MKRPTSEAPPVPAPAGEGVAVDPWADGPPSLAVYVAEERRRFETVDPGVVTVLDQLWSELLAGDLRQLGGAAATYLNWVLNCPEWGRLPDEILEYARDDCRGFEHRATGHVGLVAELSTAIGGYSGGTNAAVPSPALHQPARGWALLGFLIREKNSEGEPRWHDVWRQFQPGEPVPSNERARRFLQDELQPLHDLLVAHVAALLQGGAADHATREVGRGRTESVQARDAAARREVHIKALCGFLRDDPSLAEHYRVDGRWVVSRLAKLLKWRKSTFLPPDGPYDLLKDRALRDAISEADAEGKLDRAVAVGELD